MMAEKKSTKKATTKKKVTSIKVTKANGKVITKALENKQQYLDKGYKVEEV
jgi:hypothetical protein